ncbi:MAG: GAF domain-containing protein [Synechococcaceae cyanobacterium RM1_1_27]|nr:GAF domain-containing protein [Synechococcaceae cyanobacterium RM1_1_27]
MPAALHPANELERLAALAEYQIMDTPPEQSWDDLVQLAAKIFNVPMAWVALIDTNRQWYKAKVGIDADEAPRELTFCSHAMLNPEQALIVPDATQDERFADNPFVTGESHIRFYAGIPLLTPDHLCLGTFCVIDTKPRQVTIDQIEQLQALAQRVTTQLELRRQHRQRGLSAGIPVVGWGGCQPSPPSSPLGDRSGGGSQLDGGAGGAVGGLDPSHHPNQSAAHHQPGIPRPRSIAAAVATGYPSPQSHVWPPWGGACC